MSICLCLSVCEFVTQGKERGKKETCQKKRALHEEENKAAAWLCSSHEIEAFRLCPA